jgi:Rps23 Pro-64 3,4-dihydroxylase Tpa1-like proline 4-hydroxylase
MTYYRAENILPSQYLEEIRAYAFSMADRFEPIGVVPPTPDFRVASVLFHPVIPDSPRSIIQRHLEMAVTAMGYPSFHVLEIQVTRTPHGGYFRRHTDNTITNERALSFVFYFGDSVEGGELVLDFPYGQKVIAPCINSIVVFLSGTPHEILPVVCGDGFLQGRCTINGWLEL